MTNYVGVKEAAEILNERPETVSQWIYRGQFPPPDMTIGDRRYWLPDTIRRYNKTRTRT